MKTTHLYIVVILGCLLSCNKLKENSSSDFLSDCHKQNFYLLRYSQPINGYKVTANVFPLDDCMRMELIVSKDSILYQTIHSSMAMDASIIEKLKEGQMNVVDYQIVSDTIYCTNVLGYKFKNNPFVFYDINFDGKDELIVQAYGCGQRGRSIYLPYRLIDYNGKQKFELDTLFLGSLCSELDDETKIDRNNKMISLWICGCWDDTELVHYEIKDGKPELMGTEVVRFLE